MTDSPFEGMTTYDSIGMLGKLIKSKRWNITARGKQDCVDLVEQVVPNESETMGNRLKAVELALKMESMNQTDERLDLLESRREESETTTILILPPNGSEIED